MRLRNVSKYSFRRSFTREGNNILFLGFINRSNLLTKANIEQRTGIRGMTTVMMLTPLPYNKNIIILYNITKRSISFMTQITRNVKKRSSTVKKKSTS